MKIYAICFLKLTADSGKATVLSAAYDTSDVSFFQKSSVEDFCRFLAVTFAERVPRNCRHSLQEDNRMGHLFTDQRGYSCVVIADREYPARVAFDLISKCLAIIDVKNSEESLINVEAHIKKAIVEYQTPQNIDSILRVQKDLEETKVILHQTISSLLVRGEKLDDLVAKSDQLGVQSKVFFKTAKKTNSCCTVQ
jgi:synaptobrevin family protein YKT6